jgi:threonine dehydratase
VLRTPLRRSEWLSSTADAAVSLKLETLQPTFSYKIRGALNAVLRLAEQGQGAAALVTASAGNHGRAVAHASAIVGASLTVFVPEHAPEIKLTAMRRAGATLVLCRDYDDAERRAKAHAGDYGVIYVAPYADPDVITGAGTVGLEILNDDPAVDTIVVPVGGGGLISGVAIATRDRANTYGVEAEASCPFTKGLAAGHIVPIDVGETLADGLAGNLDPDTMTFDIVRTHVAAIATVTEPEIRRAVAALFVEERLIAEGAAATALAAVMSRKLPLKGRHVAVVLTGANIDSSTLKQLL